MTSLGSILTRESTPLHPSLTHEAHEFRGWASPESVRASWPVSAGRCFAGSDLQQQQSPLSLGLPSTPELTPLHYCFQGLGWPSRPPAAAVQAEATPKARTEVSPVTLQEQITELLRLQEQVVNQHRQLGQLQEVNYYDLLQQIGKQKMLLQHHQQHLSLQQGQACLRQSTGHPLDQAAQLRMKQQEASQALQHDLQQMPGFPSSAQVPTTSLPFRAPKSERPPEWLHQLPPSTQPAQIERPNVSLNDQASLRSQLQQLLQQKISEMHEGQGPRLQASSHTSPMEDKVISSRELPAPVVHPNPPESSEAPSIGSIGHPRTCGPACKYWFKPRGCKDGVNCTHCHLCAWHRKKVDPNTKLAEAEAEQGLAPMSMAPRAFARQRQHPAGAAP